VTFSDPPAQFSKTEIDQVLAEAQNQAALFAALNREVGKSKEFLTKVRAAVLVSTFRAGSDVLSRRQRTRMNGAARPRKRYMLEGALEPGWRKRNKC